MSRLVYIEMDADKVSGKLAIVTGGASGIGKATCNLLAKLGATVIVTDLNFDQCEVTRKGLKSTLLNQILVDAFLILSLSIYQSLNHSAYKLGVTCAKSIQKVVTDLMTKYKKPPIIVANSAGTAMGVSEATTECSEEVWNSVIDINLKGTFLINKIFAKLMKDAAVSRSIVNISSLAREGYPKGISHAASKAGVIGVTTTKARESDKFNIRCNALAPGIIETPMEQYNSLKIIQGYVKLCALKRLGIGEEDANLYVFLGSDANSYINDGTITIHGEKL